MTDVLDVISKEALWLKASRDQLLRELRRTQRKVTRRWVEPGVQWRVLVSDMTRVLDRSAESLFDAGLAVGDFVLDLKASARRTFRRYARARR